MISKLDRSIRRPKLFSLILQIKELSTTFKGHMEHDVICTMLSIKSERIGQLDVQQLSLGIISSYIFNIVYCKFLQSFFQRIFSCVSSSDIITEVNPYAFT